jgi:hypothetical protein
MDGWYRVLVEKSKLQWCVLLTTVQETAHACIIRSGCECDYSQMVGRSSGTLPTRVQILVLAPFPEFSRIYWCYALSGKRRSR